MRDQKINVLLLQTVSLQSLVDDFHESYHGMLEYLVSIHDNFKSGGIVDLVRLSLAVWPAASRIFNIKLFGKRAVGVKVSRQDPRFVRRLENGRPGAVPKYHSSIPPSCSYVQCS